jgi:prevent-host-death family protein
VRTVSVSELKAHLSRYLREVRRGGEVQILDRGVPVARLTSIGDARWADDERRERLVRSGVLRAGGGNSSFLLETEPVELSTSVREALDRDRADRL